MKTSKRVVLKTLFAVSALLLLSLKAEAWPTMIDNGYARTVAVDAHGDVIAAGAGAGAYDGPTLDVYKLSGRDGSIIWHYPFPYGSASRLVVDFNGDVIIGSAIGGSLIKVSGQMGTLLWAVNKFRQVGGLKVDGAGNVFAAGQGEDRFKVVKLDLNGYEMWSYMSALGFTDDGSGRHSYDDVFALDLDQTGNVFAVGRIDEDFAVVRIRGTDGVETNRREINGLSDFSYFYDNAKAVVVDKDSNVIVAGETANLNQGPADFTVIKFSNDLSSIFWDNRIDGSQHFTDSANDVTVDSNGDVIAAGRMYNYYPDPSPAGIIEQFTVIKFSGSQGNIIWSSGAENLGEINPLPGQAYSVVVNRNGNVIVSGKYNSTFVVLKKFAASGRNWWRHQEVETFIDGADNWAAQVALDAQNNVLAAGRILNGQVDKFVVVKLDRLSGATSNGPSDPVRAFAPLVYLHPNEVYFPQDPIDYIHNCSLRWSHGSGCSDEVVARGTVLPNRLGKVGQDEFSAPPYTHSPIYLQSDCHNPLHNPAIVFKTTDYTRPNDSARSKWNKFWRQSFYQKDGFYLDLDDQDTEARKGTPSNSGNSSVYSGVPVFYEYVPHKYITYWFFYAYDNSNDIQTHEGDWEDISIQLNDDDEPVNAIYYQHGKPELKSWDLVTMVDTHPVVYSAEGTHASYYTAGSQPRFDDTGQGPAWSTWNSLRNVEVQGWYNYGGAWGGVGIISDTTGPLGPSRYKNGAPETNN